MLLTPKFYETQLLGCNVPKLLAITIQELKLEEQYKAGEYERIFYEFDELLPDEQEREVLLMQIEEEVDRIEVLFLLYILSFFYTCTYR